MYWKWHVFSAALVQGKVVKLTLALVLACLQQCRDIFTHLDIEWVLSEQPLVDGFVCSIAVS